jgi:hypothetical protein
VSGPASRIRRADAFVPQSVLACHRVPRVSCQISCELRDGLCTLLTLLWRSRHGTNADGAYDGRALQDACSDGYRARTHAATTMPIRGRPAMDTNDPGDRQCGDPATQSQDYGLKAKSFAPAT